MLDFINHKVKFQPNAKNGIQGSTRTTRHNKIFNNMPQKKDPNSFIMINNDIVYLIHVGDNLSKLPHFVTNSSPKKICN